jgi:methoxymalonate biosynthesis protein
MRVRPVASALIKCVVWDIDNTLLDGVYLEAGDRPPPGDPVLLGVVRELAGRGILQAVASRNPPAAADYVQRLAGIELAAIECGWDAKPVTIGRIATDLGVQADALAFVDDDMIERAEVAAALPAVLVLTPEDAADAVSWPQFSPHVVTAEARRRGQLYADRRRRQAAVQAFGGSRDEFLRHVGTRVTICPATAADLPRLQELAARTRQLNSAGHSIADSELAAMVADPALSVTSVWLADDFGDDGLVGAALAEGNAGGSGPVPAVAAVPLVMMSCRALGRGVLEALLAWLCRAAAAAGAAELAVPCLLTDRNVPFRLALAASGLRADPGAEAPDGRVVFRRPLTGQLPVVPDFVTIRDSA